MPSLPNSTAQWAPSNINNYRNIDCVDLDADNVSCKTLNLDGDNVALVFEKTQNQSAVAGSTSITGTLLVNTTTAAEGAILTVNGNIETPMTVTCDRTIQIAPATLMCTSSASVSATTATWTSLDLSNILLNQGMASSSLSYVSGQFVNVAENPITVSVSYSLYFPSGAAGIRASRIQTSLECTPTSTLNPGYAQTYLSTTTMAYTSSSALIYMPVGGYFSVQGYQSSGSTMSLGAGSTMIHICIL